MWKNIKEWIAYVCVVLAGIGGAVCLLQWLGISPKDVGAFMTTLPHLLWLGAGLSLWIGSYVALAWALSISHLRVGKTQTQATPRGVSDGPISPEHPLHILSARWGIGGSAYKDVTDIVRSHATADSVTLPASIGLFGDPYLNVPKELRVDYLIARKWDVCIPENQYLKLPEKEGEEQSRKERERLRAIIVALRGGAVDAILNSDMSEGDYNVFMKLKSTFLAMPWCTKVALQRLCDAGRMDSTELQNRLGSDGFADPKAIVYQLVFLGFVDEASGILRPKDSKWIEALLKDNPIC